MPPTLTVIAEAGCILQNVHERVRTARRFPPSSLAAEGSCTLGGGSGANAGGTQVVRFGNTRELCLGLEVVTARGGIWHRACRAFAKSNAGYDLRNLMIGSGRHLGHHHRGLHEALSQTRSAIDHVGGRAQHASCCGLVRAWPMNALALA